MSVEDIDKSIDESIVESKILIKFETEIEAKIAYNSLRIVLFIKIFHLIIIFWKFI